MIIEPNGFFFFLHILIHQKLQLMQIKHYLVVQLVNYCQLNHVTNYFFNT